MAKNIPAPIREADYAAIEAAVMETQRGRWFLTEYARRNRNADTEQVLGAIDRLDESIRSAAPEKLAVVDDMVASLIDMSEAIKQTKRDIALLHGDGESDHIGDASGELDAVVEATESATHQILSSAESIQEATFAAMERGDAPDELATIDAAVMEIYEGCSFQDITGQRISKVIQTLRYLEGRIGSMATAWEQATGKAIEQMQADHQGPGSADPLLNGPAKPGEEILQEDVDGLLADAGAAMDMVAVPAAEPLDNAAAPDVASTGEVAAEDPSEAADLDGENGDTNVVDMSEATKDADTAQGPSPDGADPAQDEEWRGRNVPALAATPTPMGYQATLGELPNLSAAEIDALYS